MSVEHFSEAKGSEKENRKLSETKSVPELEENQGVIIFENLETGETGEVYNPNEKYDALDPTKKKSDNDDAANDPYQIGEEYGYPVIYHPKTGWCVLEAPLPTVFFLDQQKLEVARRYPEYDLVYSMGSEMLVRKTPFVINSE